MDYGTITCADCGDVVVRTGKSQKRCVACGYARKLMRTNVWRANKYATDPEYRERILRKSSEYANKKYATDPEFRERVSREVLARRVKKYVTDPEYRERMLRERRKYANKKYTTDPEYRERAKNNNLEWNAKQKATSQFFTALAMTAAVSNETETA